MKSITKAFTLIELLIVIVIIGILAVALIPRLKGAQARARDIARMANFKQIQSALELYAADHGGAYPSTRGVYRWGVTWCHGWHPWTWSNAWIPNLAPDYLSNLPLDPNPKAINEPFSQCYLYRSNGTDYMLLAHYTYEGRIPDEYRRPLAPLSRSFVIYTPWAKMR